jgi:prepilin-type N-terminal cleavage/methylation domain-containing protein
VKGWGMGRRRGFTLIELLVVISIIALLMAILMPSLQRSREQGKTVVCQSRLKQWGLVFSMYTGDNNGYFHRGHRGSADLPGAWYNATRDYWKDFKLLRCPTARKLEHPHDRRSGGTFTAWWNWVGHEVADVKGTSYEALVDRGFILVPGSYAINGWVQNPPPGEDTKGHDSSNNWRTFDVRSADPVPLLLDSAWYYGYPYHTDLPTEWEDVFKTGEGMDKFCIDRHRNGRINGVFLDHSARLVGIKELWRLKWHRSFPVNAPPPNWATEAPWIVPLPE